MAGIDEFAAIARWFAPLAGEEGRGLKDDAAVADLEGAYVFTTDMIVEGVHFLPTDPIATVAQKALRVSLSDLACKGAKPIGYLVSLAWPRGRDGAEIEGFAAGLQADQQLFGLKLWGGDTTATDGPLSVSVTAIGKALSPRPPDRAGARVGDDLWVSGVIGDGYLGLAAARGAAPACVAPFTDELIGHYRTPAPRLDWADLIARWATAAMDVSDGLLADAAKLAAASSVQIQLDAEAVPLSPAGRAFVAAGGGLQDLCGGGDDYQLLFTTPPGARAVIERRGAVARGPVRIGVAAAGAGVCVRGADGAALDWPTAGFSHRLG
jgi:thiamine-monophosphate kinase